MKWKVLISAPYFQPVIEQYRNFFIDHDIEIIVPEVHERLSEEELLRYVSDIDGAICGDDRFTRNVLEKAKRLKVISKWGTGIDSIDSAAAEEFGIAVRNTPRAFTDAVADTAMAFLLSFARRVPWMTDGMRRGVWKKIPGHALHESILGIIGVGDIGSAVARRAHAFGMRVVGYDIKEIPDALQRETRVEPVSLETLLRTSDYVSLHCDLNPTSHRLIGAAQFRLMKPTAVIINTARGPVIDEAALVDALATNRIAGAGLDVFEFEPLPPSSLLCTHPNVLLTSHNANASPTAWERVHKNTLNNLLLGLSGV